jgi:hypothetical protein
MIISLSGVHHFVNEHAAERLGTIPERWGEFDDPCDSIVTTSIFVVIK